MIHDTTPIEPQPRLRPASQTAVVVHSGARDAYQVAVALEECGALEALVTDLLLPATLPAFAGRLLGLLPASVRALLGQRSAPIATSRVRSLWIRGLATLLVDKLRSAPFAWKRQLMRSTDAALGSAAGRLAEHTGATLVSYSYYAYHAFRQTRAPGILFQLHPHPASMRRILQAELVRHPDCAASLRQEWELALPDQDYGRLVAEPALAAHTLVASSFTRATLIEHGTPPEAITVIPYGVDCRRFSPGAAPARPADAPLRLLFVGRINQRKGIKYLLESLRLLAPAVAGLPPVELTVCGRVVDSLALFSPVTNPSQGSPYRVCIRPDVSASELVEAYRAADLFVFPSVAEGFGQVLLEALACGLPILSTSSTAAPDLIREGVEGFVVDPGRADLLAARIEWARRHPALLASMRGPARERAEFFTWERFRARVVVAVRDFAVARQEPRPERDRRDAVREPGREVARV